MIDLPCYLPREASDVSRLATRLPVAFNLAGINVEAMMPGSALPPLPPDYYRAVMRVCGHNIRVAVDSSLLPPMAVKHWPDVTALPLNDPLRELLFDIVLRDVAVQVERWCGRRPIWSTSEITEALSHAFKIVRQDVPGDLLGLVEFDAGGLHWIADCCSALPVVHAVVDHICLSLSLLIARINLNLADLQQLAPGDVILLDNTPVSPDGAMTVLLFCSDNPRFRASILNGLLTVLAAVDPVMDRPDSLPPETLDSINLPVDVDVGQLTMPLRQVRELAVGQVLDLGFDATANVSLRINGQVVATGELVRIAERTGVRVVDMRLPRAEP
ncbi:FliM/FliN family flagellar motor switch protein [Sinorhizobium sp. 7-81]|uniref:FliM/FliN family flagellar motor switch protein n=1 Tax=unclassified Sinorhizobium TaxID=2613772 RepID=UPI0024C22CD6|nr:MULTISPECIES: FliM/FliN family flagellar motor switch protein [unclassified Sinorhizobium]MDK1389342.1 FliM/FliN family flagellar motor switch protein [Sinorhizobium sp. 7-81]MDK1492984.1 FliM/FliN family flagellar motor switch protein [Sinorhizobium sp. 8-89]